MADIFPSPAGLPANFCFLHPDDARCGQLAPTAPIKIQSGPPISTFLPGDFPEPDVPDFPFPDFPFPRFPDISFPRFPRVPDFPQPVDCGPDLTYDPITGECKLIVGTPPTTFPGQVVFDACGRCFIERTLPARTVRRRGRMVMGPNGQPACVPARRRMNVLNPSALSRALRRAKGFAKFAKRSISISSRLKLKKGFRPRSRKKGGCCA